MTISPDKTVAFTGHRPDKIKGGTEENGPVVTMIKEQLRQAILDKIAEGCTCFLSGMAMGADLWASEILLELRQTNPLLTLVAVVPFAGQADNFPTEWKMRYDTILSQADEVKILSQSYYKSCFFARNRWLLEHAAHLIAVYNGSRGGTMQTLNDALIQGHRIRVIDC